MHPVAEEGLAEAMVVETVVEAMAQTETMAVAVKEVVDRNPLSHQRYMYPRTEMEKQLQVCSELHTTQDYLDMHFRMAAKDRRNSNCYCKYR